MQRSPSLHLIRPLAAGISAVSLLLIVAPAARAVDATWGGGAGDNSYNNATNWSGGAPTANGDTATWDGTQTGPLSILWNGQVGGFGGNGVSLILASTQIDPVSLNNTANGSSFGVDNITIQPGAGAFTLGGVTGAPIVVFRTGGATGSTQPFNSTWANDSSNTATIKANVILQSGGGSDRNVTFTGAGNWLVDTALATANGGQLSVVKSGTGTLTITNTNASQNRSYTINAGTLAVGGAGRLGGPAGVFGGTLVNNGTLAYNSTASQTISSGISGTGVLTQSSGNLTLTGANTYTGATTITGGTMTLSGTGQIDSTSGVIINGAGAKFVQASFIGATAPITVTQGTLDGTGSVGSVIVSNGTGGIISHGNGGTGTLTISDLTFNGAGSINIAEDGVAETPAISIAGALTTTPANGLVTINASQTTWASGTTFDLLSFGSFIGSITNFIKGTISGLSIRQNATLVRNASTIALQIVGDNPVWTGLDNGNWVVGSTGPNKNWKLTTGPTDYLQGDTVLFNDSATAPGSGNINIPANVSPALVTFDNNLKDYTVNGVSGIASGAVIKTGTGTVTISTPNTYTGGTTVNSGMLVLAGAGTLGGATSPLTVSDGTVDLGTTSQTVGAVTVTGSGQILKGTITPTSVLADSDAAPGISSVIAGSGSVGKSGIGILTLSGTNTYSGGTILNSGILELAGAGTLGSTTGALTVSGGILNLGTTSQTVGAVTMTGAGSISNGTLAVASFTDAHTAGTATVSANLTGTGPLLLSGAGGTLVLTGANTFTGPTTVQSGTILQLGDGGTTGSLAPSSDITVANGGRFATNRSNTITQGVDFGLLTGGVQGGVIKNGTGTTILSLANTFTGPSAINNGTLLVTNSAGLGTGANGGVDIIGGSLQLSGDITMPHAIRTRGEGAPNDTAGSIMSSGNNTLSGAITFANTGGIYTNIVSSSGTLTLSGAINTSLGISDVGMRTFNFGGAGDIVASGAISDNTSAVVVSKTGAGILTLLGASSYTGGTTIGEGTVRVSGSISGTTLIDGPGAVLSGIGFADAINLANGAISPGDGVTPIGTLFAVSLTLSPTASVFNFDLSETDNLSDLLSLTDVVTKGAGPVTFHFTGGKIGENYTLMNFGGTNLTDADAAFFLTTGALGTFDVSSSALTFAMTAVPEPTTFAQLGLGFALLSGFTSRRRRLKTLA